MLEETTDYTIAYLIRPYIHSFPDSGGFAKIIEKWMDPITGSRCLARVYQEREDDFYFKKESEVFEERMSNRSNYDRMFRIFEFLWALKDCHLTRLQGQNSHDKHGNKIRDDQFGSVLSFYRDLNIDDRPPFPVKALERFLNRVIGCKPSSGVWKVFITRPEKSYVENFTMKTIPKATFQSSRFACRSVICPWCWWRKYRTLYRVCKMPQGEMKKFGGSIHEGLGFPDKVSVTYIECRHEAVLGTTAKEFIRLSHYLVNNRPGMDGSISRGASEFDQASSVLKIFHPSVRNFTIRPDLSFERMSESVYFKGVRMAYIHTSSAAQDRRFEHVTLPPESRGCGRKFPFPVLFARLTGIPLDEALYFWAMPFPYTLYDTHAVTLLKYINHFYNVTRYTVLRVGGKRVGRWLEPPSLVGDY